jgi:hypothetical protein
MDAGEGGGAARPGTEMGRASVMRGRRLRFTKGRHQRGAEGAARHQVVMHWENHMSSHEGQTGGEIASETAIVGKVVLGAVGGAVSGLVAGWLAFSSPVTAILGLLAGAVGGVLATSMSLERD